MNLLNFQYRICFLTIVLTLFGYNNILSQPKQAQLKPGLGTVKATNLGMPVNTTSAEYAPTISADGKTLIFESDREVRYRWKLYITHKTSKGWTEPVRLDSVNSGGWDGAPFLSYDQNYLIISSDRPGGSGDLDIWISQRLGSYWSKPFNIGPPVNSAGYDGFASLSSDGKTLYFVRDADNKGKCELSYSYDIYCSVNEGGKWGTPKKLPYPINSDYCEEGPRILADGKTLIFSSNRPGGYGGYDLYKSVKQDNGSWSEPVNLGDFINTPNNDNLVSIPASGDIMYFSSGEQDESDIYSVPIPLGSQPSKVITVAGVVMDTLKKKIALSAKITIINSETGIDTTIIKSNLNDGKYIVILNKGNVYDISVSCEGYTFYSTKFDLRQLENYEEITRDIFLEPLVVGTKFILNNIYFAFDSDSLLDESKYELQRIKNLIIENPNIKVEISGHSDSLGSKKYNHDLSQRRANSVVNYLVNEGIEKKRLRAKGYGDSHPLEFNDNEEHRKKNRRVEFQVIEMAK